MDALPDRKKIDIKSHSHYDAPHPLTPSTVLPDPLDQFHLWFTEAQAEISEPEVMSLCTATPSGIPSTRFVLLKQVDTRGFVFFTNRNSRKGAELAANPHAALALYWGPMHRQVRVVGRVESVSDEESKEYFDTRPLGSRIGAWASPQSQVVGEDEVQERLSAVEERFAVAGTNAEIPLPEFWGGYRVIPDEVEFWAGKPSRLHDRVRYVRTEDPEKPWKIDRLAP